VSVGGAGPGSNSASGFRWNRESTPHNLCLVTTRQASLEIAEMERAFFAKDASYDGLFFTGVRTTGIFCRPSCPARKPHRRNIEFFPSVSRAMFAGYRPCRRCRPLETDGRPPEWVETLLARVDGDPERRIRSADLRAMGLTPERVRRHFQRSYGMTFDAYCRARRLGGALEQLRQGADLDSVAFDAGYESLSGFREAFSRHFGTSPGRGRQGEHIRIAWLRTPLGPMIAGATDEGLCLLEFTDRRMLERQLSILGRRFQLPLAPGHHAHLRQVKDEMACYFRGELQRFSVPLKVVGSEFQRRVWSALLEIPYGETRSYKDLARSVRSPDAVRAVGQANGMNRISIVIPCHRVVNADGRLGGYGGGLWRKQRLLALEQGQGRLD
jgi:AraC family transcriptional regulator of adaptative response/methylated-DNA-[protein]-cysteine methyltransferase